jgi:hypothetical protein
LKSILVLAPVEIAGRFCPGDNPIFDGKVEITRGKHFTIDAHPVSANQAGFLVFTP